MFKKSSIDSPIVIRIIRKDGYKKDVPFLFLASAIEYEMNLNRENKEVQTELIIKDSDYLGI